LKKLFSLWRTHEVKCNVLQRYFFVWVETKTVLLLLLRYEGAIQMMLKLQFTTKHSSSMLTSISYCQSNFTYWSRTPSKLRCRKNKTYLQNIIYYNCKCRFICFRFKVRFTRKCFEFNPMLLQRFSV